MNENININVSGPNQPTSMYKTVILKGNKSFISQVTEPNTKYVIKHNFDLGGGTITLKSNCLIEFDGGSLSNGTIVGQNTILEYNHALNVFNNITKQGTFVYNNILSADEQSLTEDENVVKIKDGGILTKHLSPNSVSGSKLNPSIVDDEDIHFTNDRQLQFKDKEYNAEVYSGLGRKYLRKNIVNGVNTLTQSMMQATNTIYVIQYDYDLNGRPIEVPNGCVLQFEGGSVGNGTLIGNNTIINAPDERIFNTSVFRYRGYVLNGVKSTASAPTGKHLYIDGTWGNSYVSPSWNGLDIVSSFEDASPFIRDFIKLHKPGSKITLPQRTYGIYSSIGIVSRMFDGNYSLFQFCQLNNIYSNTVPIPEGATELDSTVYHKGLTLPYQAIYVSGSGVLCNFTIEQSNITTTDITINSSMYGSFGLVGQRGGSSSDNIIRNVHLKNAFECGFLGIENNIHFENCSFDGSGEHLIYGRANIGNIDFDSCVFKNPGNIPDIFAIRQEAFYVKLGTINDVDSDEDRTIQFNNCEFIKGEGQSAYLVNIDCFRNVYFNSCIGSGKLALIYNKSDECDVFVDGCEGSPYSYTKYARYHIYNSETDTRCLSTAFYVENCTLNASILLDELNVRTSAPQSMLADARKLSISNSKLFIKNNTAYIKIRGVYEVNIIGCKAYCDDSILQLGNVFRMEFFPNSENTDPGENLQVLMQDCYFSLGRRDSTFLRAKHYTVSLVHSFFAGEKYRQEGYVDRLSVVGSAKQLNVCESSCLPDKDNTILSLYVSSVTSVTYINPSVVSDYVSSYKGIPYFDYTNNLPLWHNGTNWVYADGGRKNVKRSGTTRPAGNYIYVGFQFFDTTLGKPIYAKEITSVSPYTVTWVDATGATV